MNRPLWVVGLLCILFASVSCRSFFEERQLRRVPLGFIASPLSHSKTSEQTTITFALKQRNTELLESILEAVSTPGNPRYAKYLSHEEVQRLTSPPVSAVESVVSFLQQHSKYPLTFVNIDPSAPQPVDFLQVLMTVADVESAFQVKMHKYVHEKTHESLWRTMEQYSLPEEVAQVVDFVAGFHRFPKRPLTPKPAPLDLPAGNSPVVSAVFPSSEEFTVFFVPRCQNGNLPTTSLACANDSISSAAITVDFGNLPTSQDAEWQASSTRCLPCSQQSGKLLSSCQNTLQTYNIGGLNTTVFCLSPPIRSFPNYVQLAFHLQVRYTSGGNSDTANYDNLFLGQFMSPAVLRARYGVPEGLLGEAANNSMSVAEFLGQDYSPSDLQSFFSLNALPGPVPVTVIGPNDPSNPGAEASLDIQYIMGIAPNISTTYWSLSQLHNGQEPFLQWIIEVVNSRNPPLVHSVSYADDEDSLSLEYMQRVDFEFSKAGTRGLSIFFAAGDNGVASSDPSIAGCPGKFVPSFPSSSPHITSVSGTQFSTQWLPLCNSVGDSGTLSYECSLLQEIASSTLTGSRISTGGGFSNVFARPTWQKKAVQYYIDNYLPTDIPSTWYNISGRCYGDISSSARNYPTVIGGEIDSVDGTSAATPTIAALIALINDRLLVQGYSPVGFINPALYQMPKTAFFDVLMGNNRCPEDLNNCCPYGYEASPFYDPVSGRGTPHFEQLLKHFRDFQSSSSQ